MYWRICASLGVNVFIEHHHVDSSWLAPRRMYWSASVLPDDHHRNYGQESHAVRNIGSALEVLYGFIFLAVHVLRSHHLYPETCVSAGDEWRWNAAVNTKYSDAQSLIHAPRLINSNVWNSDALVQQPLHFSCCDATVPCRLQRWIIRQQCINYEVIPFFQASIFSSNSSSLWFHINLICLLL